MTRLISRPGTVGRMLLGLALAILPLAGVAEAEQSDFYFHFGGERPFVGIEMEDVTAGNMATYKLSAERGVIVRSVEKGSPAESAGIQAKDVILEFAGIPVLSAMQLSRFVGETPVGRKVDVVVSRDGKRVPLSVTVGKSRAGGLTSVGPRMEARPPLEMERFFEGPAGRGRYSFSFPGGTGRAMVIESRPRLGVSLQPVTDQLGEFLAVPGKKGALVTNVMENMPATGKLAAGDVVIEADGKPIEDPDDLTRVIERKDAGEKLDLKVVRDKKTIAVTVELTGAVETKRGRFRM